MFHEARQRREREHEQGFTLIELMIVVLIIGVLLAIAIPTFLGARNRADDRAAQSTLRNALTAEKILYVDSQTFSADVAAGGKLAVSDPGLTWVSSLPAASDPINHVSVLSPDGATTLVLGVYSKTNNCYYIMEIASAAANSGIYYAQGVPTGATCPNATAFPAPSGVLALHSNLAPGSWAQAF